VCKRDREDSTDSSFVQVTVDLAFESQQTISISVPQSCLKMNEHIQVASASFPERSNFTTKPLEMIIAAQDHHHGHNEKFLLPVKTSSNCTFPQTDTDPNSQKIPDKILQVQTDC
jgi:hypothetical protein